MSSAESLSLTESGSNRGHGSPRDRSLLCCSRLFNAKFSLAAGVDGRTTLLLVGPFGLLAFLDEQMLPANLNGTEKKGERENE